MLGMFLNDNCIISQISFVLTILPSLILKGLTLKLDNYPLLPLSQIIDMKIQYTWWISDIKYNTVLWLKEWKTSTPLLHMFLQHLCFSGVGFYIFWVTDAAVKYAIF